MKTSIINGSEVSRLSVAIQCHWVDPTGKPERELANQFRAKAEEVENAGFQRFAVTLRVLADSYDHEAELVISDLNVGKDD